VCTGQFSKGGWGDFKKKLGIRQNSAIGKIDFGQKVVIAAVIEIHLNIIVAHAEAEMFQCISFDYRQKIDQHSIELMRQNHITCGRQQDRFRKVGFVHWMLGFEIYL